MVETWVGVSVGELCISTASRGACGLQLFECPFQKNGAKIRQRSLFSRGVLLEFGSLSLSNPNADLDSPFAHCLYS